MLQDEKKYSWLSYASFGSGILSTVITFPFFSSVLPWVLLRTVYLVVISAPISIILGIIALRKKGEKRLLANIGITLGLITGIALFFFIGFIWLITPVHPN
ncbi:hypothetical protein [Lentibacillus jeotgali]|uniref:hypothetical protein n=1 Tax=Lentibacillus jeotgali TaxID=558169 RepID=UPI000493D738|nr:hypothetical protein [Lentibacillus jeotgali]